MDTRKRIDLKLPTLLLTKVGELCQKGIITRTNYIETLIRLDLRKRGIEFEPPKDHGAFEDWGWEEKSKLKQVI